MTTYEVMGLLAGRITYRQLDYWIRTGRITLTEKRHGSGAHRTFTDVEVAALLDYVGLHEHYKVCGRQMSDGTVWRDVLRLNAEQVAS